MEADRLEVNGDITIKFKVYQYCALLFIFIISIQENTNLTILRNVASVERSMLLKSIAPGTSLHMMNLLCLSPLSIFEGRSVCTNTHHHCSTAMHIRTWTTLTVYQPSIRILLCPKCFASAQAHLVTSNVYFQFSGKFKNISKYLLLMSYLTFCKTISYLLGPLHNVLTASAAQWLESTLKNQCSCGQAIFFVPSMSFIDCCKGQTKKLHCCRHRSPAQFFPIWLQKWIYHVTKEENIFFKEKHG